MGANLSLIFSGRFGRDTVTRGLLTSIRRLGECLGRTQSLPKKKDQIKFNSMKNYWPKSQDTHQSESSRQNP